MKLIKVFAYIALAFAAGCDPQGGDPNIPPPNQDSGFEEGSRLRHYEIAANDGTKAWVPGIWFDTELGVDCSFSSPDGGPEQRCLPVAIYLSPGWYLDAACTEPVVITTKCSATQTPRYVRATKEDPCYRSVVGYWKLGEKIPDGMNFYAKMGGQCLLQQSPVGPSSTAFRLGEAVPWDAFVAASMVVASP